MKPQALVLLLLTAAPAWADSYSASYNAAPLYVIADGVDPAAPENPNAGPVTLTALAGGVITLIPEDSSITPTATLEVEGPLPVSKDSSLGRIYSRLAISTEPGQAVDFSNVAGFKSAEFAVGYWRVFNQHTYDGGQKVAWGLTGEWGAASRISGDPAPRTRLVRHYGGGLKFAERTSGSYLSIMYGRDEAAGEYNAGQIMLRGQLPITGKDSVFVLQADATISVNPTSRQHDILRIGVAVDMGVVIAKVRHST